MVLLLRHVSSLGKGAQQSIHAPPNRIRQADNLLFSLGEGREGVQQLFAVDFIHDCLSFALLVFLQTAVAQLLPEPLYALADRIKHYGLKQRKGVVLKRGSSINCGEFWS